MRGKYDFREPLLSDESGRYITAAQMQFFLNRPEGAKMFEEASEEFMRYYNQCLIYNIIYDMMDEDSRCAKMFWDTKKQSMSITFPLHGTVASAISDASDDFMGDEYDDDDFGVFK